MHRHVVVPALFQDEAFDNAEYEGEVAQVQFDLGDGTLAKLAESATGWASPSAPAGPLWPVQCAGQDSNAKPSHPSA